MGISVTVRKYKVFLRFKEWLVVLRNSALQFAIR